MADMSWTINHTKLRDTLAQLYLDRASALRIAVDAGINPAYVTFSDNAINNWHEIITKAEDQGLLIRLIERAVGEFPTNVTLKEVLGILKAGRGTSEPTRMPPNISKPISDLQLRDFINEHFNKRDIGDVLLNLTEVLRQAGKISNGPDLDIDTFSSTSEPTSSITIAMVQYFRRRTWTPFLVATVKAARPDAFREKFGE